MSKMKDFKNIADEIMCDINVSNELKEKTLNQCKKKRQVSSSRILIAAACFLLIIGSVSVSHFLSLKIQKGTDKNPQVNIMSGTSEGTKTLPGEIGISSNPEVGKIKEWTLTALDEAKKDFGNLFLTPSYIPGNFKLDKVYASGTEDHVASKITLTYFAGDKSFLIIEEKSEMDYGLTNFNKIDINGTTGYIKPVPLDNGENAGLDTEIHWFKSGVHYSVMGLITQDEATKIAVSMK
ncbi:DUF4367 domain-containing protein [Pseudobacteroides cellulosolvens]|uniref:DUF4367 domain-containing protein n=1 Tax=Pseudobacteroides cellulosolvens ATCC 35603 = DSM 2933 TaxID=398512 RepID=A0A0L6JJ67_9FIRM|nr:DUF4367 domain-containing protein [Pseudobacteroides cellulosolvens]KNY25789.1 protein of unknown function DUF4367 [Pseudobacteroides cellulosolvens ATCC 35603 = DSM 2933]